MTVLTRRPHSDTWAAISADGNQWPYNSAGSVRRERRSGAASAGEHSALLLIAPEQKAAGSNPAAGTSPSDPSRTPVRAGSCPRAARLVTSHGNVDLDMGLSRGASRGESQLTRRRPSLAAWQACPTANAPRRRQRSRYGAPEPGRLPIAGDTRGHGGLGVAPGSDNHAGGYGQDRAHAAGLACGR